MAVNRKVIAFNRAEYVVILSGLKREYEIAKASADDFKAAYIMDTVLHVQTVVDKWNQEDNAKYKEKS